MVCSRPIRGQPALGFWQILFRRPFGWQKHTYLSVVSLESLPMPHTHVWGLKTQPHHRSVLFILSIVFSFYWRPLDTPAWFALKSFHLLKRPHFLPNKKHKRNNQGKQKQTTQKKTGNKHKKHSQGKQTQIVVPQNKDTQKALQGKYQPNNCSL